MEEELLRNENTMNFPERQELMPLHGECDEEDVEVEDDKGCEEEDDTTKERN